MDLIRPPRPDLQPFVDLLWAKDPAESPTPRERVLPTGTMYLAFRLAPEPIRLYRDPRDRDGWTPGHGVVGGARSTPFLKDVEQPARSVGAMLRPGAARALFGRHADALAERHLPLVALWGRDAVALWHVLARMRDAEAVLDRFEAELTRRLPRVRGVDPVVAEALEQFTTQDSVAAAQVESGYSQRGFINLFRREVGLAPKRYLRVLRLQRMLAAWQAAPMRSLAELALDAGYSDQSHLQREFRALTGITPGEFRRLAPVVPHHVPLGSDSFKQKTGVNG